MITNEGLIYEQKVSSTLEHFTSPKFQFISNGDPSFSSHKNDVDLIINGEKCSIEVKKDFYSQMGGTSIQYDKKSGTARLSKEIPSIDNKLLLDEFYAIQNRVDEFLEFVSGDPYFKDHKMPLRMSYNMWDKAKKKGYLKFLNIRLERPIDFIHKIYKNKGINYIQIGGSGLFYLSENPFNLPIPQLTGKINIELRLGRSGKTRVGLKGQHIDVVGASYRVQGRLKHKQTSPYTLDDPLSISRLFSTI
jgi:hypothetical protein